jgi:hypothetical protein
MSAVALVVDSCTALLVAVIIGVYVAVVVATLREVLMKRSSPSPEAPTTAAVTPAYFRNRRRFKADLKSLFRLALLVFL